MTLRVHLSDAKGYRVQSDLAGLREALADEHARLWIDADEMPAELQTFLQDQLGLNSLVVEDVVSSCETPKIEDYGDYVYAVLHGVRRDSQDPESLNTIELDVVIGQQWVLTHHTGELRSIDEVRQELQRNPRALTRGPAWLAHTIIDHMADHYLPVLDRFDDEIDELEKGVMEDPRPEMLGSLFRMKRSLQRLRRISVYQREILQRLSRGEFEIIPQGALLFYRDIYDHFVRIADLADSYRELVNAAMEIYLSVTANRTNEIMKVLAIISTIMLPLSFIAGVYGMNFHVMPELSWRYGYPFALSLMGIVSCSFLYYFRRKKWI